MKRHKTPTKRELMLFPDPSQLHELWSLLPPWIKWLAMNE